MIKAIFLSILFLIVVAAGVFYWGYEHSGVTHAWLYLDRLGLFLGLLAFVPIMFVVWKYVQFIKLEEKERKNIQKRPGNKPAVLIVSIGGMSIRNDVESYLRQQDAFKDFAFSERVFEVHRENKEIHSSDVDGIIKDLEIEQDKIRAKAADKIHLFIKAPLPIAAMTGEVLANQIPTLIYHKQQNKGYENWGVLHR